MNRQEQKERIADIITKLEDAISAVKNYRGFVEEITGDYSSLLDKMNSEGFGTDDVLQHDEEQFTTLVVKEVLINQGNLEEVQEDISDFKDEIQSYADELSESRAEKLEERYVNLEEVYDAIYALTSEDDVTVDSAIETMEENIIWLKEMKK